MFFKTPQQNNIITNKSSTRQPAIPVTHVTNTVFFTSLNHIPLSIPYLGFPRLYSEKDQGRMGLIRLIHFEILLSLSFVLDCRHMPSKSIKARIKEDIILCSISSSNIFARVYLMRSSACISNERGQPKFKRIKPGLPKSLPSESPTPAFSK